MDLARIEFFLDDGWNLIGRMHRWLSKWPQESSDQLIINDLIRSLQKMWATANDLESTNIARNCLALELMLERFCAGSLEFSVERLEDFTAAVACLQELLLCLEATREEPNCPDITPLLRIEHHALKANWDIHEDNSVTDLENISEKFAVPVAIDTVSVPINEVTIPSAIDQSDTPPKSIERTLLKMLEQFVLKLDDICQQLHLRMVTDQTPYVTTTSRLEHLAQVTRGLVDQILHQPGYAEPTDFDLLSDLRESSVVVDDFMPLIVSEQQIGIEQEDFENTASTYSMELARISSELTEMLPQDLDEAESDAIQQLPLAELKTRQDRILIVEESLFYRHLLSTAVNSAGYEAQACETLEQGFAVLRQTIDFVAILVDSQTRPEMVQAIKRLGQSNDIRMIGMTTTNALGNDDAEFDDSASKTHPQKLIGVLNRVLQRATADVRISA